MKIVRTIVLTGLFAGCAATGSVDYPGALADYKQQDHFKALATSRGPAGSTTYGRTFAAGSPWFATEVAIQTCERYRRGTGSKCKVTWLGNYDVSQLSPIELQAALFDYAADATGDPTRLAMLEQVERADAADGRPSVAAIAVVGKQGRLHWGFAIADTFAAAREQAVGQCGSPECMVANYYLPGECVFVVQGETQVFWGAEPGEVVGEALDFCELETRDCQVVHYQCIE